MNQNVKNNNNLKLFKIYNNNLKLKYKVHFHTKELGKNQNKNVNYIKKNIKNYQKNNYNNKQNIKIIYKQYKQIVYKIQIN